MTDDHQKFLKHVLQKQNFLLMIFTEFMVVIILFLLLLFSDSIAFLCLNLVPEIEKHPSIFKIEFIICFFLLG